jgi:hypothetical protein
MTTRTVTLDLPETLYNRLSRRSQQSQRSLEDELLTLLATNLPIIEATQGTSLAFNEVIEFLGRGATAEEVANFRLSATAQARAQLLLEKNKEGTLSSAEEAELDLYIELENFMALIKIQALKQLIELGRYPR